ncbi:MAG: TylF/MycF/NovP-related O-methyltransferase [Minisyncoccia bacterium]
MSIIQKIKLLVLSSPLARNLNNLRFDDFGLVYKIEHLNNEYYEKIKNLGDAELEHQIGRLTNFKSILNEISINNTEGDILEFGSWRGFSLLWTGSLCENIGMFSKKIIGIDGFVGLLEDDGVFKKGMFNNTSLKLCRRNIQQNNNIYSATKKNIFVEQFLFSQKNEILETLRKISGRKFAFVHIDSDVSGSVGEIFDILIEGDLLEDECYLLFDDYGCATAMSIEIDKALSLLKTRWDIVVHSSTMLTKNFKLTKIKSK